MATAGDLILRAYRRGRILGSDQVLSAARGAAGLAELNDLLDELWNDKLAVYRVLSEPFNLIAGQQTYTIGTGGNFNTTRPVKIVPGSRYVLNGIETPLAVLTDRESWDSIPYKALQGPPQVLFYDAAYPMGNVLLYPTPDQAYQVYLNSWSRLQGVLALVTALTLPPGYNRLLVNGLAIALCPENGMAAPPDVVRAFNETKRLLALVNYEVPMLEMPGAVLPYSPGGGNILSGEAG